MFISAVTVGLHPAIKDVMKQFVDQIVEMEENVLLLVSVHVLMVIQGIGVMELLNVLTTLPATQATVVLDHVPVQKNFLEVIV